MMDVITIQNSFVSDGNNRILSIPSGADWMNVINLTKIEAAGGAESVTFEWRSQMSELLSGGSPVSGIRYFRNASDLRVAVLTQPNGFIVVDQNSAFEPIIDFTRIFDSYTNAAQPVVTMNAGAGGTAGLSTGDVVTITGGDATNLRRIPVEVGVIANPNFTARYAFANNLGASGTAGTVRRLALYGRYRPRWYHVINMTSATQAVVSLNLTHDLQRGQQVRFYNFDATGGTFSTLNNVTATIVAVGTGASANQVTVNFNSSALGTFTLPTTAANKDPLPIMVPFGEDTGFDISQTPQLNILTDAVENQGVRGIKLIGGADQPGGANNDLMIWQAGKVTNL